MEKLRLTNAKALKGKKVLCRKEWTLERYEQKNNHRLVSEVIVPLPSEVQEETPIQTFSYQELLKRLNFASEVELVGCQRQWTEINFEPKPQEDPIQWPGNSVARRECECQKTHTSDKVDTLPKRLDTLSEKISKATLHKQRTSLALANFVGTNNRSEHLRYESQRQKLIENVSGNKCTATAIEIKEKAFEYAQSLADEINSLKRRVVLEIAEIEECALKIYQQTQAFTFPSDQAFIKLLFRRLDKTVLALAYQKQASSIIGSLRSGDIGFASKFFFGTNPKETNISPICNLIHNDLLKTYQTDISQMMIATYIYEHFMEEDWKIFDKFGYHSSLFYWMKKVSIHAVYKRLRHEGYIPTGSKLTHSNSSLKMLSIDNLTREYLIDELIQDPIYRQALKEYFTPKLRKQSRDPSITRTLGKNKLEPSPEESPGKDILKANLLELHDPEILDKALSLLKQRILDYPQEIENVLSSKKPSVKTVSFEDNRVEIINAFESEDESAHLSSQTLENVIIRHPRYRMDLDYEQNLINITLERMPLSMRDRKILKQKILDKKPTKEIAETFGINAHNVTQILNRLIPSLCKEIEGWWHKNIDPDFSMSWMYGR